MLRKAIVWEAKPTKAPRKKMLPPASTERPAPPSAADLMMEALLTAPPATPWVN